MGQTVDGVWQAVHECNVDCFAGHCVPVCDGGSGMQLCCGRDLVRCNEAGRWELLR